MTCRDIQRRLIYDRYNRGMALPNYTPSGWFECDVFEITKSGFFREYEIKLSVSDFKADAAKAKTHYNYNKSGLNGRWYEEISKGKHDQLAARSVIGPTRFYYVTPVGLLGLSKIPEWAGLIEIEYVADSRWPFNHVQHTLREAPQLHRSKVIPEIRQHANSVCYWRFMKLWLSRSNDQDLTTAVNHVNSAA